MSSYISFPPKGEILSRLRGMDSAPEVRETLYRTLADRLGSKVYDGAAFAFILIETLHAFEAAVGEDLADFIPRCVFVLTEDHELAHSARAAFAELRKQA